MREGKQAVKERDGSRIRYAERHNLRLVIERSDKNGSETENQKTDPLRENGAAYQTKSNAGLDAILPSGSEILADKGGERKSKTCHRQERKTFKLGICAAPCHRRRAKGIDV